MNLAEEIARHLTEVSEGGNWTEVSLLPTLENVRLREATTLTPASPNTIAAIVHHLAYWNRVMLQRLTGVDVPVPEANGFDVPHLATETDWQELVNDYQLSARELAAEVRGTYESRFPEPILPGRPSVYKSLQGTVEHLHYHLGQVVVIKRLAGQHG